MSVLCQYTKEMHNVILLIFNYIFQKLCRMTVISDFFSNKILIICRTFILAQGPNKNEDVSVSWHTSFIYFPNFLHNSEKISNFAALWQKT